MKLAGTLALGLFLACTNVGSSFGQAAKKDQPITEDMKDAGKATGRAAKKTGKKIAKGTKKGVNKAAEKTEEGAAKVKEKTNP